jgi:hypothetical protein
MAVLENRHDQPLNVTVLLQEEAMRSLYDMPAIVAPSRDEIDLFPLVLSDVGKPERSCFAIEGESPGIPNSIGEDFRTATPLREWIVRWNGIGRRSVHINAENLPQQLSLVLCAILWIAA